MASNLTFVTSKKQSLLDYKSKLLYDIKNCEREIEEARRVYNRNLQYKESGITKFDSDSDSDDAIYQKLVKTAESKNKGIEKNVSDNLKICLQATEELTDLHILHSDISIMVEPPQLTEQYKHEEVEEGVWREVHADCKADFVPFSIAFYVHQPYRKHSPPSYHNVQVGIVKKNHEKELESSILSEVQRPSDAIQIMRNYAVAHRCRRTTLVQLVEKYANGDLHMEVTSDGSYLLRCAEVLELTWRLENKWSPVARFYHQMRLNVESMDDHYIKTVKKAFMQLRQPNMKADERAFLLSKIIDICIQFRRDNNDSDNSNDIDDIVRSKTSSNQKYTSNEGERKRKKSAEDVTEEACITKKAKPSKGREVTELVEKISKRYSDDGQTRNDNNENLISKNSQQNYNEANNKQKRNNEIVEKRNKAQTENATSKNIQRNQRSGEANNTNQKKKHDKTNTENNKEQHNNKEKHNKDKENALKEKSLQDKLAKNKHSNNPNVKNPTSNYNKVTEQQKNKQNTATENKEKQNKNAKTNKMSKDNKENNTRTKIPQKISLHKKFDYNPLRSSPRKSPRNIAGQFCVKKNTR